MAKAADRYSFSFITGALFAPESCAIIPLLAEGRSWTEVETEVARENTLKARTSASRARLLREIKYRLSALSSAEIEFLVEADKRELAALLFVGICRHYAFVREFVLSALRPKVLALDFQIMPSDFTGFLHRESQEHEEITTLTDKSLAKIRQVIFRMLAEASLVDSTRTLMLTPSIPSRAFGKMVAKADAKELRYLLLSDSDIRHLTT
jgi:hypothetical protein